MNVDIIKAVLHQKKRYGLRPVEFAAQQGQGCMVMAIMNTPVIYLVKQETLGLINYTLFVVSDYEYLTTIITDTNLPLRFSLLLIGVP